MADARRPKMRTAILDEIQSFIRRHGADFQAWQVGTAASARTEMFDVRGFKTGDVGLFRRAASAGDAASLAAFLIRRGAAGDGATKPGADYIYAFKRKNRT